MEAPCCGAVPAAIMPSVGACTLRMHSVLWRIAECLTLNSIVAHCPHVKSGVSAPCRAWSPSAYLLLLTGGASAASSNRPALTPLNRFPRMVQEYFVDQVRQVEQQGDQRRAAMQEPPGRRGLRPRRSGQDPAVLRPLAREDAAEPPHHGRGRARPVQDREGHLREPPGLPGHRRISTSPRAGRSRCPAWSAPAATPTTARPTKPTRASPRASPGMGYVVLIFDPIGQGERLQYPERAAQVADRRRRPRAPLRGQPAVPRRRVLRHLAGLGRHPRPGLPAHAPGGRSEARRRHRQLRRRHDDHVAVRRGPALDDGRPELLRHDVPPQLRERAARRHGAVPAAGPGAGPGPLGLPRRDGPQAHHPAHQGRRLLRRPRRREGVRRLRRLYGLLGAEENIALFIEPGCHGYTQESREAMYRWFNRATRICDATDRAEPDDREG